MHYIPILGFAYHLYYIIDLYYRPIGLKFFDVLPSVQSQMLISPTFLLIYCRCLFLKMKNCLCSRQWSSRYKFEWWASIKGKGAKVVVNQLFRQSQAAKGTSDVQTCVQTWRFNTQDRYVVEYQRERHCLTSMMNIAYHDRQIRSFKEPACFKTDNWIRLLRLPKFLRFILGT